MVNGLANAGYSAAAQGSEPIPSGVRLPGELRVGRMERHELLQRQQWRHIVGCGRAQPQSQRVQGYATGDSTGYYAAARTASPTLSAVGVSVGSLGVVTSSASCLADGSCTASSAVTGASLLGGLIRVQTGAGGSAPLQFSLDGGTTWRESSAA